MSKELKTGLTLAAVVVLLLVYFLGGGKLGDLLRAPDDPDRSRERDPEQPDAVAADRPEAKAGSYLFCFWNVENLFDDSDDGRKSKGDSEFDPYFGTDADALAAKLKHLTDVLMKLNDGRGPDVLGVCEVESRRAAQLLADSMNKRLGKEEYSVTFRESGFGRHISPGLITRLPVVGRVEVWGSRQRILKAVVRVNDHDLTVVVSHWTSRVTDDAKDGDARSRYADAIHGKFRAAHKANPAVDFLVCGDFNDNPDDRSVTEHLRATGDLAAVKEGGEVPRLFDLFAKAYADGESTVEPHGKKNAVFDHVCASPGLFDAEGWSCDPESARIVTSFADRKGRPNRFGGKKDKRPLESRGASDHFPVTVRLRVR